MSSSYNTGISSIKLSHCYPKFSNFKVRMQDSNVFIINFKVLLYTPKLLDLN